MLHLYNNAQYKTQGRKAQQKGLQDSKWNKVQSPRVSVHRNIKHQSPSILRTSPQTYRQAKESPNAAPRGLLASRQIPNSFALSHTSRGTLRNPSSSGAITIASRVHLIFLTTSLLTTEKEDAQGDRADEDTVEDERGVHILRRVGALGGA